MDAAAKGRRTVNETQGLTDEHIRDVCRMGQGAACCSFLILGSGGFECAKGTSLEQTLRVRREFGMTAQGDNCSGPPDYAALARARGEAS